VRALSTVAVLVLVVAVCFLAASCSKQPTGKLEAATTTLAEPKGGGAGEVAELADDEPVEGETEEEPEAIVGEVGAPVFEGAAARTVETEGDTRKAIYLTDAEYDAVRDFYLEELAMVVARTPLRPDSRRGSEGSIFAHCSSVSNGSRRHFRAIGHHR